MNTWFLNWYERYLSWLWSDDLRSLNGIRRSVILSVRMLAVMLRQLLGGQLNLRAMSLVYTTLLSIVPLLAVSFSVLKGFGVHNQLEPVLLNFLEPLGPNGVELSDKIIGFVENIRVGVLGLVGLAFLFYTVVSLIQKIEETFNYVWRVEAARGLAQRFSSYLSVILVGPVLVFASMGLTATLANHGMIREVLNTETVSSLVVLGGHLLPYLLVIMAFSFFYILIPNTMVKKSAALAGGVIAGLLWKLSGLAFAVFISTSSNYAAIYSGFAIVILLLIWLYLSWLILLLGAQIAFYIQYPQYLTRFPVEIYLSSRLRERISLQVMYLIAEHHMHGKPAWTLEKLVHYLGLPMQPVYEVLRLVEQAGYIAKTANNPPGYLPMHDLETISLAEVFSVVRSAGENRLVTLNRLPHEQTVEKIMEQIQAAYREQLGDITLRELVASSQ